MSNHKKKALRALREQAGGMRPGQDPLWVKVNVCTRQPDGSLLYGEYVEESWLDRPFEWSREWAITPQLIDAIPHLAEAIIARLRQEVPLVYADAVESYGDLAVIGSPPHPGDLTDRELLERWLAHDLEDEVYSDGELVVSLGDPDLYVEPMTPEYANPFQACVRREFPGLSEGCGESLSAEAVLQGVTSLDEGVLHSRLVEQVPGWGKFLDLVGPWQLESSAGVLTA